MALQMFSGLQHVYSFTRELGIAVAGKISLGGPVKELLDTASIGRAGISGGALSDIARSKVSNG